jgi:type I restriction enzyme R subunit
LGQHNGFINRKVHDFGLTEDEIAFYAALEVNDSPGTRGHTLKPIARELVDAVKRSVTIDWTPKRVRLHRPS